MLYMFVINPHAKHLFLEIKNLNFQLILLQVYGSGELWSKQ